ncbi:chaplin [Streptomyces sp. NPDC059695]|uniref:chaplin n=1 Tax=unclassified Streptomyces TaxID=2593676 RepID=UPI0036B2ED87
MNCKKAAAVVAGIVLAMGVASPAFADADAAGAAIGSPGVLSGNVVQIPIHIPINACGNSVNVIGLLNPAIGNTCINA